MYSMQLVSFNNTMDQGKFWQKEYNDGQIWS